MSQEIRSQLESLGLRNLAEVYHNLSPAALNEMALSRREGVLAENGALIVSTGERTGRSPKDRFVVASPSVESDIWWGPMNQRVDPAVFGGLINKTFDHAQDREVFVFDGFAGADPNHRLAVRVITEKAWHALFARTLFLRPSEQELARFKPDYHVLCFSGFNADPSIDGTNSHVFVGLNFEQRQTLILGTHYGGEIKKSIFSVMNYLLPMNGVLSMHCSANVGSDGATALFFGLSGTGKTTLSSDPGRRLIGDDEHGWSEDGVFNIEGGCYAKTIRLSQENEPQIWDAIRFGSVLENVVFDPDTRTVDFDDDSITENTRVTYPVDFIDNCVQEGMGGHPSNIMFLTCDAFGVLPPICKLTHDQAYMYFLSGYTAKVAGTEAGVDEPQATFSPCFGGPFLPLPPMRYGQMLKDKLKKHGSQVWLINTGWSGGPAGRADRIRLRYTRAMLSAALSGQLAKVEYAPDPVFGLQVPKSCPDVPAEILFPRNAWSHPDTYDAAAKRLFDMFQENFKKYA